MTAGVARNELPGPAHESELAALVDDLVARWRRRRPPMAPSAFDGDYDRLHRVARIFLREETEFCRTSRPRWFEAAIGLPSVGAGTPLDTPEPCAVPLPRGGRILVRGRLDRIDEVGPPGAHHFAIWDYKMGSDYKYMKNPPYSHGRVMQHVLYRALAEARLRDVVDPGADVVVLGYFFPGPTTMGTRLAYDADRLTEGPALLERLVAVAAARAFVATTDVDDCRVCDFRPICGDVETVCARARAKVVNEDNGALEPFRELRDLTPAPVPSEDEG